LKPVHKHITNGLLIVLVILVVFLALSPLVGWRFDIILSGSMEPSVGTGDLAIVGPTTWGDLRVGDIIIFNSTYRDGQVCHRIIEIDISNQTIQTKGDANEDPDPFLAHPEDIVGKVHMSVPYLGYLVQCIRGPLGIIAIIGLFTISLIKTDERGASSNKKNEERAEMKGDSKNG